MAVLTQQQAQQEYLQGQAAQQAAFNSNPTGLGIGGLIAQSEREMGPQPPPPQLNVNPANKFAITDAEAQSKVSNFNRLIAAVTGGGSDPLPTGLQKAYARAWFGGGVPGVQISSPATSASQGDQ